jgi:CDP-glucose 4,6-dehydratase
VLEPLSGYIQLAGTLASGSSGEDYPDSWNFGPELAGDASVGQVAETVMQLVGAKHGIRASPRPDNLHETQALRLDSSRARFDLGWTPRWPLKQALERTLDWHSAWRAGDDMRAFTICQLDSYLCAHTDAQEGTSAA